MRWQNCVLQLDRIDQRDKEDIQTLFKEVALIKQHIGMKTKEKIGV